MSVFFTQVGITPNQNAIFLILIFIIKILQKYRKSGTNYASYLNKVNIKQSATWLSSLNGLVQRSQFWLLQSIIENWFVFAGWDNAIKRNLIKSPAGNLIQAAANQKENAQLERIFFFIISYIRGRS
ncbi:hypothetical protein [Nitrosomonas sp. Nm51]|uniref:hypothetical protein n=1 Tax=Nitrosomonas sp. Nm51 TaxID=133720 RepID=UPI001C43072A|nr:hypothetical protein [Nitrosomonas sp. Nm51]